MTRPTAFALTLLSVGCFAFGGVRGSGRSARVERQVAAFDSVHVGGGIVVNVSTGPQAPLVIEADDNLLDLVETTVSGGELDVHFRPMTSISSTGAVTVTVRAPKFRALEASGGSRIEAALDAGDSLAVSASGGAVVRAKGVKAGKVSASGSGGATLELAGSADELALDFSGGSRVRAQELAARSVTVQGSGGCTGKVRAAETIRGSLSGGCNLSVAGKASSRVRTSGGSSVDFEND